MWTPKTDLEKCQFTFIRVHYISYICKRYAHFYCLVLSSLIPQLSLVITAEENIARNYAERRTPLRRSYVEKPPIEKTLSVSESLLSYVKTLDNVTYCNT